MEIILCTKDHSQAILNILNEVIVTSTSLYDYVPRTRDSMNSWFDNKIKNNFPIVGVVNERQELLGFGSYGAFRAWPAYKYTIEHSLYVHKDHRGKGYGKLILGEIINRAKDQEYHTIIAGIDSNNDASKALHESFGFKFCGRIEHAGYKFSRWLDLDFYQLLLPTPVQPAEG